MMKQLTEEEQHLSNEAIVFAKKNKKHIAREIADKARFPPEDDPMALFMAGSPGAGKTEASQELLSCFLQPILRIDPDEFRCRLPGYKGNNSYLFQAAVSILTDKVLDAAFKHKQSFLLDGTLSHYAVAEKNISRSIKKGRPVQIFYVYQDPLLAWDFVCSREDKEGRRIEPSDFIEQYFGAHDVVNKIKKQYGTAVMVDLLFKNNDCQIKRYESNIDQIDSHLIEKYTPAKLQRLLATKSND